MYFPVALGFLLKLRRAAYNVIFVAFFSSGLSGSVGFPVEMRRAAYIIKKRTPQRRVAHFTLEQLCVLLSVLFSWFCIC